MKKELKDIVIDCIEEKKGENIKIYNLEGKSPLFDYSIICTGTSSRNVEAIVQEIKKNITVKGVEGEQEGNWVLIDAGDLIVSVFTRDARDYYQIDEFYESV